jgi:GNAT superfamily N-acetyltransferase
MIHRYRQDDAAQLVSVICEANAVVAKQFDITLDNNPKHPSFYTEEWLAKDIARGEQYFVAHVSRMSSETEGELGCIAACVAFEHPRPDTAYLNRLSVLPQYQRQGIGRALVEYVIDYAKSKNITFISIGIIASHAVLKEWYIRLGFVEGETKVIDHLPFDVAYLRLTLP